LIPHNVPDSGKYLSDILEANVDLNITPDKLCFMSEPPWQNPSPEFLNAKDILRLEITVTGKNVPEITCPES
jgi:hypothetical protein